MLKFIEKIYIYIIELKEMNFQNHFIIKNILYKFIIFHDKNAKKKFN